MDMPGLLPEDGRTGPSPVRWVLGILVLIFLLMIGLLTVQLYRFKGERDRRRAKIDELMGELRKPAAGARPEPASLARRVEELEARLARFEADRRAAPPAPGPGDPPAPAVRPRDPEAAVFLYVAMGFARRGLCPEAARCLEEALRLDPETFWKVKPQALAGPEVEVEKLAAELEKRARENPLDADARVILAYLCFHDPAKGPAESKLLLLQVLNAHPDHAMAKKLLEGLER